MTSAPEHRRKFIPQFRAEAVQMVIETGKTTAEVARDVGIHDDTVGSWVNAWKRAHPEPSRVAASRSPWQRGTNENANKLLRQYLPKGTSLSTFSQAGLNAIAAKVNNHPRMGQNFRTLAERVALTDSI